MNSKINSAINTKMVHHPSVPNPAPLGLIAFGLTTALLQVKHSRLGGDSMQELAGVDVEVMGFALFFGGLLQVRRSQCGSPLYHCAPFRNATDFRTFSTLTDLGGSE
jgi:succinate-acetate transporter protein